MPLEGEYEPSTQGWVREQVERYEATGGREANTLRDTGIPIAIFWTRGAKSGKVRKNGLMRVEHDGAYAMVASVGGAPKDPAWVANVRAFPDQVTVQDGPEPWGGVAREVTGEEREQWWQRAVAVYPPYEQYARRTDREIPVFVVERRS